jgi:hypothetical protein
LWRTFPDDGDDQDHIERRDKSDHRPRGDSGLSFPDADECRGVLRPADGQVPNEEPQVVARLARLTREAGFEEGRIS